MFPMISVLNSNYKLGHPLETQMKIRVWALLYRDFKEGNQSDEDRRLVKVYSQEIKHMDQMEALKI